MWTDDEDDEPLGVEDPEPTPVEQVEDFFEKYGDETVFKQDLGYDCWSYVDLEQMYQMFRLRYELEKEGNKF